MHSQEFIDTLKGLSQSVDIKNEIESMESGDTLDEAFALAFLGMKYVEEPQEIEISKANTVETHYVTVDEEAPVFLPNVSEDNNLAVMVMEDMAAEFSFEYTGTAFKVPYDDKAVFEGKTIGEAVMKALLFGKAIQDAGIEI